MNGVWDLDSISEDQRNKLDLAQEILEYKFEHEDILLSAITHPSAIEGRPVKYSYERLEFLGDSILGAIVAWRAFHEYHDLNEGGLTRVKVSLVSGAHLSDLAQELGFADVIVFGQSEAGTGRRGLHSALENVYEATVAALFLDGGMDAASAFVDRTLIPRMNIDMAREPENPKSALQERLQEDGITPTYKLIETQGPPHDRTFTAQVFAGNRGLAQGTGRTKKEAESKAAQSTLARLGEYFGFGLDAEEKAQKKAEAARIKAEKQEEQARIKAEKQEEQARQKEEQARQKAEKQEEQARLKAEKQEANERARAERAQEKARKKEERANH